MKCTASRALTKSIRSLAEAWTPFNGVSRSDKPSIETLYIDNAFYPARPKSVTTDERGTPKTLPRHDSFFDVFKPMQDARRKDCFVRPARVEGGTQQLDELGIPESPFMYIRGATLELKKISWRKADMKDD